MDFRHQHQTLFQSVDEIAANIQEGATIAIGGFWFVRLPIALVNALIRKGAGNLTIITQASGLAVEQLIAAGLVKKVIFSFMSLDIFGLPPFFRKAVESGSIEWEEWTALRMNQALEAGRQNLPSSVMQLPWGSAFMEETDDFKVTPCPITGRPIGVMRSIQPDVALIHAQRADARGNIQLQGALGIDRLYIGASKQTFVSVEEVVPEGKLADDPRSLIIPHFLINRICEVPGGAYPSSCLPYYITDYWKLSHALKQAKETGSYEGLDQPDGQTKDERVALLSRFAKVEVRELEAKLGESVAESTAEDACEISGERTSTDDPDQPAYTIDELMACLLAEQVKDQYVTTVGSNTPLSMVAYLLAKKTHAPDVVLIPYTGLNDIPAFPVTMSLAEVFSFKESSSHWAIEDLWQWIYQKSLTAIEFGSTAQMDQHGRINNSIIGTPDRIKVRLPGQAGLADVLNLHHNNLIYITRQDTRRLVEAVDFSSGARHFLTQEEREQAGLPDGVSRVLTNLGVFELDRQTRRLALTHMHPGVTLEQVQEHTGFPLEVRQPLQTTKAPTAQQLHLIRHVIDPYGFRKLEFSAGAQRNALIREMLDKEQQLVLGSVQLSFAE